MSQKWEKKDDFKIQVIACCISIPGGFTTSTCVMANKLFTPTFRQATTVTGLIFCAARFKAPALHGNAEWKCMKGLHTRAAAKALKTHPLELYKLHLCTRVQSVMYSQMEAFNFSHNEPQISS